ncbi:LuxR C-terminal-related transcriptional regulator [Streptomyces sp. NPDC059788]|uniref:LuxR C-terminal-related transcriptional regulator n=1 Tax=Streptomyces sp. NPDC059788 TaxID=3346948 RepID=UPI003667EDDF
MAVTGLRDEQLYAGFIRAGRRRSDPTLLEREEEQAELSCVVTALGEGRPAVVSVTGRPGFGHNALLRWTARLAEERSVRVLRISGSLSERDLRYGAVAQLLTLLGEMAEGPLRELRGHHEPGGLPGLPELLHSVRRTPTLVTVEDAQWLDAASLHWLQALVRRLSTGVALALLTGRTGLDPHGLDRLADAACSARLTRNLTVRPLSPAAVAALVEQICGTPCDEVFAAAATQASHGSPAVLHAALHCFAGAGHRPTVDRLPQLRTLITGIIGDRSGRALRGLTDEATAVLRALAVAGDLLDFPLVCSLAGLRTIRESRLRGALEVAGFTIPDGTYERVRMPVVRARILEDMPAAERADLHARAAHLAYRGVADDEDIARLLLQAPPIGEPWAVHALRGSFGAALRRGDFARAATYLDRALDEPQDPLQRAQISLDLASAEAVAAPEAGDRRLATLVHAAGEGEAWSQLRVRALDMGLARGDEAWGRSAAAEALATAQGDERDHMTALYWYATEAAPEITDNCAFDVPALPEDPLAPAQAGVRAWQLSARGLHRTKVAELARRALDAGNAVPVMPRLVAARALWFTDAGTEAEDRLAAIVAELRRRHRHPTLARALVLCAELHLRGGRMDAAERAADAAERALPAAAWHPLAASSLLAVRTVIAMETGRHDEARALCEVPMPPGSEYGVSWPYLLYARGRLAAVEERSAEAVELYKESGRWLLRRQWVNPVLLPWRSTAARTCLTLGDQEQAQRLFHEELVLARRWGAPSALGLAHLSAGCPDDHEPAAGVREPRRIPGELPARLAYTRLLADLATEVVTQGDRAKAARLLTELSRLTATDTSSHLAERIRFLTAWLEAPTAPEDAALSEEWAALSPAERQTAELARRGLGNREIAEQLAVSRRTVEHRLSSTYRKLRITSRKELREWSRQMEKDKTDAV